METVKISKKDYGRLKKLDDDVVRQFNESLEDLKKGRFSRAL